MNKLIFKSEFTEEGTGNVLCDGNINHMLSALISIFGITIKYIKDSYGDDVTETFVNSYLSCLPFSTDIIKDTISESHYVITGSDGTQVVINKPTLDVIYNLSKNKNEGDNNETEK